MGLVASRIAQPRFEQQPRVVFVQFGPLGVLGQLLSGVSQGLGHVPGGHVSPGDVLQMNLHFPRRVFVLGQFGNGLPHRQAVHGVGLTQFTFRGQHTFSRKISVVNQIAQVFANLIIKRDRRIWVERQQHFCSRR